MPWWAVAYTALIVGIAAYGAVSDRRRGDHWARVVADLLTTGIVVALFVSYWRPALTAPFAKGNVVLLGLCVIWAIFSTKRDIDSLEQDPELSPVENARAEWLGIVAAAIFIAPSYAIAAFAALRSWGLAA